MFDSSGLALVGSESSEEASSFRFRLSPEGRCFDGHFEGLPVLPGVAHLAMVAIAQARRSGRERDVVAVRDLRFQRTLAPGDEVDVILSDRPDRAGGISVRFEIRRAGAVASSGLVTFATGNDGDRR